MRNFNNIRTIDLKEYLPDVLKDVQEMRAIMEAETPEVQAIWDACEDCMNDQFISEATENGVARREKMLGITPFATDTLDDRKLRLLSRYNENIPYTRKSLAALLESLCGALCFDYHDGDLYRQCESRARRQEAGDDYLRDA